MDFDHNDILRAISRLTEKRSRQEKALQATDAELKLWNDLLPKQTGKK